jgi:hypothetical protein
MLADDIIPSAVWAVTSFAIQPENLVGRDEGIAERAGFARGGQRLRHFLSPVILEIVNGGTPAPAPALKPAPIPDALGSRRRPLIITRTVTLTRALQWRGLSAFFLSWYSCFMIAPASLLLLALLAPDQRPKPPTPASETQKPLQDKRGTSDAPLIVQIKGAQAGAEASDNKERSADTRIKNRELLLTAFIALAAFVQAGAVVGQIIINRKQSKIMNNSLSATRNAAAAAQTSADATLKSVTLQEAKLRQWVDIDDWKNTSHHMQGNAIETSLIIKFMIGNPTEMPLTLTRIDIDAGRHGNSATSLEYVIALGNGYPADFSILLKEDEFIEYKKGNFLSGLKIAVGFVDVLEKDRRQNFMHLLRCGSPNKCEAFEHESKHEA